NPIIKAHYHLSRESKNRWERIGADNLDEALCYLDRRHRDARSQSVVCADAEVGQLFRYELTAEESLYRIQELNLAELFDVQAEVYVLRRPNGEVAGLSVVIPIKEETLSYLHADNYASPYMNTLRPTEQSRHLEANGCFIRTIDIENVEDESLRHDSFSALLDLLLTYDIVVSSPPPLRYFLESHHILGFTPVTGASHHQYDGITTGQTFLFDRRGSKFIDYLARLVGSSHQLAPKETLPDWEAFTERETEVARLVLEGLSNAQISSTLFISIITVKKHVSAIYRKLNVRNRAQLTKKLIGGNSPHDTRKD
ncbi:MAG: LuxR C-terminal-related transcriptional regulator, partial [Clostridia bacterium]